MLMSEHHTQPTSDLDNDIRDSIGVMHRQRNTKLILVLATGVVGLAVLLVAAYLGLATG
jgi:hypothetical protein